MRWYILTLLLMVITVAFGQSIDRHQLRMYYIDATQRKSALDSLTARLENISTRTPCEESYLGGCYALGTQQVDGNWAKLKLVYKAKNCLNHAVERDPKDTELRFLRFMLEHFLPAFLGLNKHISEDLKVVFEHPDFVDEDPPLKKSVVEFLLWTKRCTPQQTALLEKELASMTH